MEKLPVIICSGGGPGEIGRSHGEQLQARIAAILDFYFSRLGELGLGAAELRRWGDLCRSELGAFSPELAEEIAGIAEGARREPWELFALNARSELIALGLWRAHRPPPSECTALFCPSSALLAQNWDWDARLDSLPVLLRIPRSEGRPEILTLTEPGMVAKIGMNECGVGVCLNFLSGPEPRSSPEGVPVHCLLRLALSCDTLQKAEALLRAAPRHCSCHILLADAIGQYRMLEFSGTEAESAASDPLANNLGEEFPIEGSEWQVVQPTAVVHTNHYLHPRLALPGAANLTHSRERCERARRMVEEHDDALRGSPEGSAEHLALLQRILGDRHGAPESILYDDAPGVFPDGGPLATVCSIIMDLRARLIHITKGDAMKQDYVRVPLLVSNL